ncbi:MAG: LlaJI family restriction endonuclease [Paraglaciecola sp.]|nr:LlaJI family restriction endonuclease [Paraglaciecola sp.]
MQPVKSVLVFRDRTPVLTLASRHPEILSVLKGHGLISNSGDRVHFCGVVSRASDIAVFLPRSTREVNSNETKKITSMLLRAIHRYARDRDSKIHSNDEGESVLGSVRLSSIISLLDDYANYGLYSRRVSERTINSGKLDWKRTVANEIPFLGNSGPVYLNIRGNRRRFLSECEVARIHAKVIRELDRDYSWLINGGDSSVDSNLIDVQLPLGNTRAQIAYLETQMQGAFSDRDVFLFRTLIQYLETSSGYSASEHVIGVKEFHGMWEHMLHQSLHNTFPANRFLAAPVYRIDGGLYQAKNQRQRTDTVLKDPNSNLFTIVDAKYYAALGLPSSPQLSDIIKQLFYAQALKLKWPNATLGNAFVFPGGKGPIESVHMSNAEKKHINDADLLDREYPPIRCFYVEPLLLIDAFVKRKKLDDLSFQLLRIAI